MYCANHPTTYASGICSSCGKPACQNCGAISDGRFLCKACAGPAPAVSESAGSASSPASKPGQKNNSAFPLVLIVVAVAIVGLLLAVVVTVVLAAVIAAFVFGMVGGVQQVDSGAPTSTVHANVGGAPTFTVQANADGSSYTITLVSMGGAASIKGFQVQSPYLAEPNLVDTDASLHVSQTMTFTPQSQLSRPIHFIAVSSVDGKTEVVLDTYVS